MRNKTYEVVDLGQYYPLFGIQSVKTSFCYILIFFSLTKILSLSFLLVVLRWKQRVGLTTTVKVNGTFGQVCSTSMNTDGKHNTYLSLIHYSNIAKIFPTSQACIYYYTNERLWYALFFWYCSLLWDLPALHKPHNPFLSGMQTLS